MESDCERCRPLIAELMARLRDVEGRLKDLQQKFDDKSPPKRPEADMPAPPPKKPTGRKPGGQPGHQPHLRNLLPADRVTRTVPLIPKTCRCCQQPLSVTPGPDDPEPTRHQVVELPKIIADVTEYQGHSRKCTGCGTVNTAAIPAEIRSSCVGPRLVATCGILTGQLGLSKRNVEEVCNQLLDVPLSLGTVANLEREVADALAAPYAEVVAAVEAAPVKNVDETGWLQNGRKRWLWIAVTRCASLFMIHPKRDLAALRDLVGAQMKGILCTDRWCVYDRWADPGRRQLCWAHLKRNWEAMVERGGAGKRVAEAALRIHEQVFELWHRFRDRKITRPQLIEQMEPSVTALQDLLNDGCTSTDARTARFCTRLHTQSEGIWTFLTSDGVEPTNNSAERALRRAVVWRRRSFGCHSADGCRFAERILTVVTTLKQTKASTLDYLTRAIAAHRAGQPAPKLLPEG